MLLMLVMALNSQATDFSSQELPSTARVSLENKIFTLKGCVNVDLFS
jgi:hypothetical protein